MTKAYFEGSTGGSYVSTDDHTLYAEILQKLIMGMADEMLDFGEALTTISTPGLDYRLTVAEQTAIAPQEISEGGQADFRKTSWFDVYGSLKKFQTPIMITDESKARLQGDIQLSYTVQTAAQGLADAKDNNIKNALQGAASNSFSAVSTWDDQVAADTAQDIASAIGIILSNTTLPTSGISDIKLFYPTKLFGFLSKPMQVGEIQQSIRKWVKDEFAISFIPTRKLTTSALCVVKSDMSALHYVHDGSFIDYVEYKREEGVGDKYLFTQLYDTAIIPTVNGGTTNNYITEITGVTI